GSFKTSPTPQVCRGIHQPRGVKTERDPEKHAPNKRGPTTNRQQHQTAKDQRHKIEPVQPNMHRILHQVGSVTTHHFFAVLLRCPTKYPAHVRPPATIARRVWIAGFLSKGVMDPMSDNPIYGAALEGK